MTENVNSKDKIEKEIKQLEQVRDTLKLCVSFIEKLQKEKQNLEKELALIKKPTISKNVFTHEPIDDILASIF